VTRGGIRIAMQPTESEGNPRCSFCHLPKDRVAFLVESPADRPRVYICDECIEVCHSILEKRRSEAQEPAMRPKQWTRVGLPAKPEICIATAPSGSDLPQYRDVGSIAESAYAMVSGPAAHHHAGPAAPRRSHPTAWQGQTEGWRSPGEVRSNG